MRRPSERGKNHNASVYVRVEDSTRYENIDQRIARLAAQRYGELGKEESTTPRGLMVLEIAGQSSDRAGFEESLKHGYLFDNFSHIMSTFCNRMDIGQAIPDIYGDSKMWLEQGYLFKKDGSFGFSAKDKGQGYGMCMDFDNNCLVDVTKQDCENMRSEAKDIIRKYPSLATIVHQESF